MSEDELRRWLDHLIKDGIEKGVQLDYKRELRLDTDRHRRDLAQDASAFANQVGGTLLYGVEEESGNESSRPASQGHGVKIEAGIEQRIQDILTDAVTPRLPRFGVRRLPCGDGDVLIVWVPQSYLAPHMVHAHGAHRFYQRSGDRTRPMSEHEVARSYERRQSLTRRPAEFRQSVWAERPLLQASSAELMWAAQYLLVPTLPSALQVQPPGVSAHHDGSAMNWLPSPVGEPPRV